MTATNSARTLAAIAWNEVLLNSKRVAPYVLMILFAANAVLWWRQPAINFGWAANSDWYIVRNLLAFSFLLGMPIFNAVTMGDAVSRDFRVGIDPLIFSKPVTRAQYLFGKFLGNFFVFVCCQAVYPLTQLVLQAFPTSRLIVLPFRVFPYFKHFFFFLVITHLALAAFYFTVGSLTRNSKIVYGLAVAFYPLYISYGLVLVKPLSDRWRMVLDPLLLGASLRGNGFLHTAEFLNQYVVRYTTEMVANRLGMILLAASCLSLLYVRFKTAARSQNASPQGVVLGLATAGDIPHTAYDRLPGPLRERIETKVRNESVKLKRSGRSAFSAVFWNEVLLNSKRVAPYVLILFAVFNASLWSLGQGSTYYGQQLLAKYGTLWAINSDYYIAHHFSGFALGIFGLPIFAAVIMAEPVRRDFRLEIHGLIFSKPVSRTQYLLGKFLGSFFVLVCCQASFAATLVLIQIFHPSGTFVLPFRLLPYFKHFILIVVVTYVLFAAVYFTVGTLTRNAKIVYGLAIAYYPLIAFYEIFLTRLPPRWRVILSPLMLREVEIQPWGRSPEWVDRLVVNYTPIMFANRALVILAAAVCLTIVCRRFRIVEPSAKPENFSWVNLSASSEVPYFDPPVPQPSGVRNETAEATETVVPCVTSANAGLRANLAKLAGALDVEFRLLRAERSLIVVMPLAIFLSILEVAFFNIPADVSHSAAYATNTAKLILLFLIALPVFYLGEAMHRDREVRIEPVLWATPASNAVLWLSKFMATLLLTCVLMIAVCVAAILIQLIRGHTPIDTRAYLKVFGVVLLPGTLFITAFSLLLNVLLRNKYVVYVVTAGTVAGLFYLYNLGYNHWLYNPVLYGLWSYSDLTNGAILGSRMFWLAATVAALAMAHFLFPRKPGRRISRLPRFETSRSRGQ